MNYRPELDTSPLLADDAIHYFQSQISILCWAVELGRIDIYIYIYIYIYIDTALLSQYLVQSRQGHLEAVYHIYIVILRNMSVAPWLLMMRWWKLSIGPIFMAT